MKKYDFENLVDRRNTNSIKWNVKEDVLPMWIADMDFSVCDEIRDDLIKRLSHPVYGYTEPDESFFDSYIHFYQRRHHVDMRKSWMFFSTGVVPTISSTVRKLTKEKDNVVVLSPVYNIFYNSIVNNGRNVLQVPLLYEDGKYEIDFPSLEKAFSKLETTLMIFCNPANPVSKIWSKEELIKIGFLAEKYHVVVLSDEIHCELTRPGKEYIPYWSVNETNKNNCVIAISPTKAFNMAGLQTSLVLIPNPDLKKKVERQLNTDECAEPNVLALLAAKSAFDKGEEWLDQLREKIFQNRDFVSSYVEENIPQLKVVKGDATYLVWIDISSLRVDSEEFASFLRREAKLFVNDGKEYGGNGASFIRMNVATSLKNVQEGLERLKYGVELFLNQED